MQFFMSYLCIVDHMDALVNDAFAMISQEVKNVLNLGFERQAPQPDAVLPRASSDHLLG